MTEIINSKIVINRKRPRIWIQGKKITNAGFPKDTKITIKFVQGKIIITKDPKGDRKISGICSIIDINSSKIYDSFPKLCKLRAKIFSNKIVIEEAL